MTMKDPHFSRKETEKMSNDLKHAGNSINQLREQENANIFLASKEIGQQMDNNSRWKINTLLLEQT